MANKKKSGLTKRAAARQHGTKDMAKRLAKKYGSARAAAKQGTKAVKHYSEQLKKATTPGQKKNAAKAVLLDKDLVSALRQQQRNEIGSNAGNRLGNRVNRRKR